MTWSFMDDETKKIPKEEVVTESSTDALAICRKERDDYLFGWQRAKADFLNYKKEEAERMTALVRYSNVDIVEELTVVLDNLDLAILTLEKQSSVDKGIEMIRAQLFDLMRRRGLERLTVEIGKPLDPLLAEAVTQVESELPEGAVVEEVGAGYKLYDKVLRPVRVKVSKGQPKV